MLTRTIDYLINNADGIVEPNADGDETYEKSVALVYKCFRLIRLVSKTEYNKCKCAVCALM